MCAAYLRQGGSSLEALFNSSSKLYIGSMINIHKIMGKCNASAVHLYCDLIHSLIVTSWDFIMFCFGFFLVADTGERNPCVFCFVFVFGDAFFLFDFRKMCFQNVHSETNSGSGTLPYV